MKTKPFLTTSLLLVTILAFVYFAQPIYAKANSGEMDYVETSDSTQEVVELFSGVEVFIPVAIIIIGFIAMTYCTLRNVDIPLDFSDSTSFFDKCRSLGQFVIDNASDPIKNVLYSVYTYCQENNITSITGMAAFVAKNAASFFVAFSKWFNSSFISDKNELTYNFLELFQAKDFIWLNAPSYSYADQFSVFFNQYSGLDYSHTLGGFCTEYSSFYYGYYYAYSFANVENLENLVCVICPDTYSGRSTYTLKFYNPIDGSLAYTDFYIYNRFRYSMQVNNNGTNVAPSGSSSAVGGTLFSHQSSLKISPNGFDFYFDFNNILNYLLSLGFVVGSADYLLGNTLTQNDIVTWVTDAPLTTPASDNVYYPTKDWVIDLWKTWDDVATGSLDTLTDKVRAFVGDISLTLDSALANTNVIEGGGEYVFPSMDGIWKYPQYFFDTLKGWGLFVGGCLNAVTVGEGGLSWLFYGGFIIIVCGGIIGKILLG